MEGAIFHYMNYEMYIIIDWRGNGMCSRITAFCDSKHSLLKPKYFISARAAHVWEFARYTKMQKKKVYPNRYHACFEKDRMGVELYIRFTM